MDSHNASSLKSLVALSRYSLSGGGLVDGSPEDRHRGDGLHHSVQQTPERVWAGHNHPSDEQIEQQSDCAVQQPQSVDNNTGYIVLFD